MSVTTNQSNNYINDADSYMNILIKICNVLEDHALKNKDERAKLYKQLAEYLSQGGKADFTMVDRDIYFKVEAALKEAKIPYVPLNNPRTDCVGIAVRDIDRDKFKEILDDILLQDGKYNTQVQIEKEFDLARKSGHRDIAVIRTRPPQTALDFEILKDVLNKNNIVCGAEDFNINGEYHSMTTVLQDNLYNTKGRDLAGAILETYIANISSLNAANFDKDKSFHHYKQAQLQYNHNIIKDFTVKVRDGKSAILMDYDNPNLYIKFKNQELEVFKKNDKGEWDLIQATTLEKNSKNRTAEDEVKRMRSIIAKFTPDLNSKPIVVENEAIMREQNPVKKQRLLSEDYYLKQKGGQIGLSAKELFGSNETVKIPKINTLNRIQERLEDKVMPQVNKLAHQRASKVFGFTSMTPKSKHDEVCKQIEAILKDADCTEIQEFLKDSSLQLEGIDKREILTELAFAISHDTLMELDVIKVKDAEIELQDCREHDDDYAVRYVKDKDKDKDKEAEEERDIDTE